MKNVVSIIHQVKQSVEHWIIPEIEIISVKEETLGATGMTDDGDDGNFGS